MHPTNSAPAAPAVPTSALTPTIRAALLTWLPLPPDDTPDALAEREARAMAAASALRPADAFEAELAARIIGADFHAKDAFRAASRPGLIFDALQNYRAQAASMSRTANSSLRELLRLQAERRRADALQPTALLAAEPPQPPSPPPQPPAAPAYDPIAAFSPAERWCIENPGPATRIRAERRLPRHRDFNAPTQDIVDGIIHGTGPVFRSLDTHNGALPSSHLRQQSPITATLRQPQDTQPPPPVSPTATPSHPIAK